MLCSVCVCVLVFVLLSVLFVLFMVPMFAFTGRLSVGTETVGVKSSVFVCCQLLARGGPWASAPLCVPLNVVMAFCQESWCCEVWFCFYASFTNKLVVLASLALQAFGPCTVGCCPLSLAFWSLFSFSFSLFASFCLVVPFGYFGFISG